MVCSPQTGALLKEKPTCPDDFETPGIDINAINNKKRLSMSTTQSQTDRAVFDVVHYLKHHLMTFSLPFVFINIPVNKTDDNQMNLHAVRSRV